MSACNPYANRSGDYWAGTVDPVNFPAAYRGSGFRHNSSVGQIKGAFASVTGRQVEYYSFPMPSPPSSTAPLIIGPPDPTKDPAAAAQPSFIAPRVYLFDPMPEVSPFPSAARCTAPTNYLYDVQRDPYPLSEQGPVFTMLPDNSGLRAFSYTPLVTQVSVTSNGESCNEVRSEEGLVKNGKLGVKTQAAPAGSVADNPIGVPDAPFHFLAMAIIDPSACVSDVGCPAETGFGIQRLGWYDHLLLAYIEGGYIPTRTMTIGTGMAAQTVNVIVPQNLYVPNSFLMGGVATPNTMPGVSGLDVLEHKRGQTGYSPICHVLTFTPNNVNTPETSAAQITAAQLDPDMGNYIACLQVR